MNKLVSNKVFRGGTTSISPGQYITDGSAIFLVIDQRDGTPVGRVLFDSSVRPGYIKANGARITTDEHPRITKYMIENNLYVTEEEHVNYPGLFGYNGEDSNSFLLPDLRNLFIRGKNDNIENGQYQEDAIRNITGSWRSEYNIILADGSDSDGALYPYGTTPGCFGGSRASSGWGYGLNFDASRIVPTAEENRPVNISYIPVIRY